MRRVIGPLAWLAACLGITTSAACAGAIGAGASAPDFTATSVVAGKHETFHLAEARTRSAVVLYFFPEAFSAG